MNGSIDRPSSQGTIDEDDGQVRAKEKPKATRTANPMSFSSILSSNVPEPPKATPRSTPASKPPKVSSSATNGDVKPSRTVPRKSAPKRTASPKDYPGPTKHILKTDAELPPPPKSSGSSKLKPSPMTSDKENERVKKEMAKIDAMPLSPIELPEYEGEKKKHAKSSQKRQRDVETSEEAKRKVS